MTASPDPTLDIERMTVALEACLTGGVAAEGEQAPLFGAEKLDESMRYSLRTPGKRIRPLLLMAAANAVGAQGSDLVGFAAGLEMIHAYSLIHDDLPAMDDDELRRGQPTNHMVYGDGMAILAGDGLLTEAFVVMLEPVVDSALQLRVVREVARAAGRHGMVGGQAADLLAEGIEPDEETVTSIHRRKTGALMSVSVRAGALLGGADDAQLLALERFGDHFGLAFQIADDIKDEVAPPDVTGKTGGGDRRADKMTYPSLLGVESSRARCRKELDAALTALAPLAASADTLVHLAKTSVAPAFDGEIG